MTGAGVLSRVDREGLAEKVILGAGEVLWGGGMADGGWPDRIHGRGSDDEVPYAYRPRGGRR
jgi:hypothetical protein